MAHKTIITECLKKGWVSNYQMQRACKSSSADRAFRLMREAYYNGQQMLWEGYKLLEDLRPIPEKEGHSCKIFHLVPAC